MNLNCTDFDNRADFSDFILLLNISTNGNFSLASSCAPEICQTLWGTGNPDISGVGAAVAYVMTNTLAPLLTTLCMSSRESARHWPLNRPQALQDIFDAYQESALFFAFSIQVACTVLLTRVTFGMTAEGMGDLTVRTTWTVAVLSLLPLVYRVFLSADSGKTKSMALLERKRASGRQPFVFPLFAIAWAVFMYTFLNRMASIFEPSQIGQIVSSDNWDEIVSMCTADWQGISNVTDTAINVIGIGASALITILTIGRLALSVAEARNVVLIKDMAQWLHDRWWRRTRLVLLVICPLLSIGLIWAFFTLQYSQRQLAAAIKDDDQDEQWSFGQIVSVAVFTPVIIEAFGGILLPEGKPQSAV